MDREYPMYALPCYHPGMDAAVFEHLKTFLTPKRLARMETVLNSRTRYLTVVLEDIYQPHNASAVVRTCDALGIQDLHAVVRRNAWRPNDEVSLGSAQWLDLDVHSGDKADVRTVLRGLKSRGYRIVATTPHERAKSIFELDVSTGPIALVFGTELTGISTEVSETADEFVYIPMYGFVESFNISVSVAMCLAELGKRIRASEVPWQLSAEERQVILDRWVRRSVKRSDVIEREFLASRAIPQS